MAKHKDTTLPSDRSTKRAAALGEDTLEHRVVAFAEQLGGIVGAVQAKADGWLDRQTLNDQLTRIRDKATDLLGQLGTSAAVATAPARQQTTGRRSRTRSNGITAHRATAPTARSGGKVDAPGKTHRTPPPPTRGVKHSDETISKLKAARTLRNGRRG